MKKLLLIFSGMSITATAASAVVACDAKIASFDMYASSIRSRLPGWNRQDQDISQFYDSPENGFRDDMPVETFINAVLAVTKDTVKGSTEKNDFTMEIVGSDDESKWDDAKLIYNSDTPATETTFTTKWVRVSFEAVKGSKLWRGNGSFMVKIIPNTEVDQGSN
ncbi:lipoprotein [Spiroplasma sabaudiense]|uniref:lipoprotein n=1 Tax=Spiroplasma sabaudiense TaxID=216944 RepID=UPI00046D6293|nr:lipoprotein [Spiroplasma sabaudiense]